MAIYYIVFAVTMGIGVVLQVLPIRQRTGKRIFCIASFLILGSLSAFRYDVGVDYSYIYAPLYESIILANPAEAFSLSPHEPGFVLLEKAIALFSSNYQMLFIVTSYLIVGLFILYYYHYSPSPLVSVFLFIALSQFYCSMNFLRQTLAAVICMYAFVFMQRRKIVPYVLIVLLASTIHLSALIMLVFYVVNLIPVSQYTILIFVPMSFIIYLNSSGVVTFVVQYVYSHYDLESEHFAQGFPLGFFIINLIIFLFLFCNQKVLLAANPRNYLYINYAFLTMFFIFMGTKHSILDRFSLYFEIISSIGVAIVIKERLRLAPRPSLLRKTMDVMVRRQLATAAACVVIVLGGGVASHHYALSYDHHGVVPYKLIFQQSFYSDYVRSLHND